MYIFIYYSISRREIKIISKVEFTIFQIFLYSENEVNTNLTIFSFIFYILQNQHIIYEGC